MDPLAEQYSYQSPYNFAENKVIDHVELEGLEGLHHTLSVPDNGYDKGGVLNMPPGSLIPKEIDEIINNSVPAQ